MINNLLNEIMINIQNNLGVDKYKSVSFENDDNKVCFLIYKKDNYLKTPLVQINFSQDSILHIYANIFIKSQKSSSFVLIINPNLVQISDKHNETDIADFISYVTTKIKTISSL